MNSKEGLEQSNAKAIDGRNLIVVGIGASAGGLVPLKMFFQNLPAHTGMAFIIVQHLSPDFKSLMGDLLANHTPMPIQEAVDGIKIKPNHIYLIPPRNEMVVINGRLHLNQIDINEISLFLPINTFFTSLAREYGRRAIGIILSGAGSDGSEGIKEIGNSGGLILVQDEESSQFSSMPISSKQTGQEMSILRPEEMPKVLIEYAATIQGGLENETKQKEPFSSVFSQILTQLEKQHQTDFKQYKMATLVRRIERRMMVNKIQDPAQYLSVLQNDSGEVDKLYRDLLIDVTAFFRNREAFDWLMKNVIPDIVNAKSDGEEIRVWVAACASGEEAYSLAILFYEEMVKQKKELSLKIFATDLHEESIERASEGVFKNEKLKDLPEEMKRKYFTYEAGYFKIDKTIRSQIVFAQQNLLRDSLFTNLDMISCRNLLIYLLSDVQKRVLSHFHFGLKQNGILFLGPSEHLGELEDEFEGVNREWRIYKKVTSRNLLHTSGFRVTPTRFSASPRVSRSVREQEVWETPLLKHLAGDSILIDENHRLVQIFGEAAKHLKFSAGPVELDIAKLLNPSLFTLYQNATYRMKGGETAVAYTNISLDEAEARLDVSIDLIEKSRENGQPRRQFYLMRFKESQQVEKETAVVPITEHVETQRIKTLEDELAFTRESLQSTLEEVETTNEELQTSNEELMSSNEELQSVNEELQSVNEELYTVNTEYMVKNQELIKLNNDMINLQRSSGVLTIFLDKDKNIRSYTPAVSKLLGFLPQDIGRPIFHLSAFLSISTVQLESITQEALNRTPQELEVKIQSSNKILLLQALPFVTEMDNVEGIVLQFTDLTNLRRMEEEKKEQELLLTNIGVVSPNVFVLFDVEQFKKIYVSGQIKNLLGYSVDEVVRQKHFFLQSVHPEDAEEFEAYQARVEETSVNTPLRFEGRFRRKDGTYIWLLVQDVVHQRFQNGKVKQLLSTFTDISELRSTLHIIKSRLETINNNLPAWISYTNREYIVEYANRFYEETFNIKFEGIPGKHLKEVVGTELFTKNLPLYKRALEGEVIEFQRRLKNGMTANLRLIPEVEDGDVQGFFAVGMDVSTLKKSLQKVEQKLLSTTIPLISIHHGEEHTYIYANEEHSKAVGNRELLGRPLHEAMPELVSQGIIDLFDQTYRSGEPFISSRFSAAVESGDSHNVAQYYLVLQPLFDADKKVTGVITFVFDLTASLLDLETLGELKDHNGTQ